MPQPVESAEQFPRDEEGNLTPQGEAQRWAMEFAAARERLKKWHGQGDKIYDRFLDERDADSRDDSRLNLFTANVETQHSMLYGKVPGVDVARRFDDAQDDVARVAAEMWERLLEPQSLADSYCVALEHALEDRLLPGFGCAVARYEVEWEPVPEVPEQKDEAGNVLAPAVPATERKANEKAEVDYHFWKDWLWSPCRTFESSRWFAFMSPMTRADAIKRFGDLGKIVPLNAKTGRKGDSDAGKQDPWGRVEVWEIWSKEDKTVYWFVEGFDRILDKKPDPLGLEGFYPFPRPMMARTTNRSLVPRPDFVIAQDLYNEIDDLTGRITALEDAIRVTGGYDKTAAPELAKMVGEKGNRLYPVENMALLAEKGGMQNAIVWLPLEPIVKAIAVLTEKRMEKIGLLQQVTGWSDVMRGQSNPNETLGAQKLKAGYGSVRIQRFQDEFARFASDLQRIRAEIISKHFDVETIIERSNVLNTTDAKHAQAAAALIKDRLAAYRIEVKPESMNLTDYAAMKQERVEVVQALGGLIASMVPLIQFGGPPAAEFALAAAGWLMAGTKGGDALEGEFDNFRAKVQQAAMAPKPPPPPDPKVEQAKIGLETAKVKGQVEMAKAKTDMAATAMDAQAKQAEHGMKMQEMQMRAAMPQQPVVVEG